MNLWGFGGGGGVSAPGLIQILPWCLLEGTDKPAVFKAPSQTCEKRLIALSCPSVCTHRKPRRLLDGFS
jgi:hypothetical protein